MAKRINPGMFTKANADLFWNNVDEPDEYDIKVRPTANCEPGGLCCNPLHIIWLRSGRWTQSIRSRSRAVMTGP